MKIAHSLSCALVVWGNGGGKESSDEVAEIGCSDYRSSYGCLESIPWVELVTLHSFDVEIPSPFMEKFFHDLENRLKRSSSRELNYQSQR
ncbi:hypothetical protein BgiBS90_011574 [Biomphalaria glabrata]|nr:hypothetical protein BgiBS90_011574 [Biomphalaria glabrata]